MDHEGVGVGGFKPEAAIFKLLNSVVSSRILVEVHVKRPDCNIQIVFYTELQVFRSDWVPIMESSVLNYVKRPLGAVRHQRTVRIGGAADLETLGNGWPVH